MDCEKREEEESVFSTQGPGVPVSPRSSQGTKPKTQVGQHQVITTFLSWVSRFAPCGPQNLQHRGGAGSTY